MMLFTEGSPQQRGERSRLQGRRACMRAWATLLCLTPAWHCSSHRHTLALHDNMSLLAGVTGLADCKRVAALILYIPVCGKGVV